MPFGKYKGEPLEDLPGDYLEWLSTLDLRAKLREAVAVERDRRLYFPAESNSRVDTKFVHELVSAGVKVLAKRYHADAGGSHEAMVAGNRAADWLRTQVGSPLYVR